MITCLMRRDISQGGLPILESGGCTISANRSRETLHIICRVLIVSKWTLLWTIYLIHCRQINLIIDRWDSNPNIPRICPPRNIQLRSYQQSLFPEVMSGLYRRRKDSSRFSRKEIQWRYHSRLRNHEPVGRKGLGHPNATLKDKVYVPTGKSATAISEQ
jgi:hypothetical protein